MCAATISNLQRSISVFCKLYNSNSITLSSPCVFKELAILHFMLRYDIQAIMVLDVL